MNFRRFFFLALLIFVHYGAKSKNLLSFQQQQQSKPSVIKDTTSLKPDTGGVNKISINQPDSVKTDTAQKKSDKQKVDKKVVYSADSINLDAVNNIVYMYGKANVKYGEQELDAGYIRLDQKNNTVFAKFLKDSDGNITGTPIFKDPSQGAVTSDSVFYNFKSSRGKTFSAFSEQDGGFISGGTIKKQPNNEVHVKNVTYSTCNLPEPHTHFGVRITKGIATDKQIISGPAYLIIEDVPLPVVLPFGFFPKPNKRSSGIIFPQVGEDATLGFFLRDFGYYLGLTEYWDLTLKAGVYSRGSYEGNATARYTKRYKYDGNVFFSYSSRKFGVPGTASNTPTKDFNIRWSHNQNANAKPGTTFSASVNAGTSSFYRNQPGNYNVNQLSQNDIGSSISYGKVWAGTPFSLNAGLTHRQDLSRNSVSINAPNLNFNMATINPFDSKDRVGEQKWYQRLTVGYSLNANNNIDRPDSLLFSSETLEKMQSNIQHNIPISLSSQILKFFQFSQNITYTERWYLQTIRKNYQTVIGEQGSEKGLATDTVQGFRRAYEYNLSAGLSTKFYGAKTFKKGKIVALRHVMTPNVGFGYRPDFGKDRYGYYQNVRADSIGNFQRYSIFEGSSAGGPGFGRQAALSFGLENNVEMKVRSTKDTTGGGIKKIPILQGLNFNGSYNFAADSFKLSPISFSGRTFFTEKLGISFFGSLSPYVFRSRTINGIESGREIDRYTFADGKLPRLTGFGFSFDYSLNSSTVGKNNQSNNPPGGASGGGPNSVLFDRLSPEQKQQLALVNRDANAFVDFNIPWNVNFSYSFNYSNQGSLKATIQTLNVSGDFSVTPKWKVQYNSGYDFQAKNLSLTRFSIYRDLHCWDLSINWVPFGPYKSYNVDLRVRSSILQDLKLSKRREYYNDL